MGRIRRALGRLASRLEALFCRAGELMPPVHLRWRYFGAIGRDQYRRFAAASAQELLARGLEGHHRVLDVGCGIGPLAVGLIPHLTEGCYEGFDVHEEAIAWCERAIAARHPRFRFRHADLFNITYNRRGTLAASAYRFPYGDAAFDFAFLGSICTHLLAADVAHYLSEVARVLRPGGKCVVSFYLLDDAARLGIETGASALRFVHRCGAEGSRVVDPHNPEMAIAHSEDLVRSLCGKSGLQVDEPIRRGRWREGEEHQQDVITAVKRE